MIYSIPYLLLMLILGVLGLLSEGQKDKEISKRYTLSGIVMFFLFFGLRGLVFHDWNIYYPEYQDMDLYKLSHFEFGNVKMHEPGWMLFEIVCKSIWDNYFFMIGVLTLIDTFLLFRFLSRYTYNILLAIVIFLAFEGCPMICNTLRNFPAILIFLNAIPYLEKRKLLPYLGMCLLAASIHFSALIFIPLYFFIHRGLNKWIYLSIVLVCNLLFIAHVPIIMSIVKMLHIGGDFMTEKLEVYADMQGHRSFGLGFIERLITAGLIFCYYDKLKTIKASNKLFINAFVAYLVMFTFFSEFDEMSKRMSMLFMFAYWILWPDLIKCFAFRNNRLLFSGFVGLYCMLKIITTVNQPVMEYDNVLFGAKSYPERKYIFEKTFEVADLNNKDK